MVVDGTAERNGVSVVMVEGSDNSNDVLGHARGFKSEKDEGAGEGREGIQEVKEDGRGIVGGK